MIRRQTGIVVLVFFALVIVALLLARSDGQELEQAPTPAPEPIWSIESRDIVGLIVEDLLSAQVLELRRDEQDLWRMIRPEEMPADAARVERAASWLAEPQPRAEIFDAMDLTAFELDEPHYRITVHTANGDSLELIVGRQAPTGGSRYASYIERPGVLIFSTVGLDEVLRLGPDLIPPPTPQPTPTPTAGAALTPIPEPTLIPTDSAQEPEG